MSDFPVELRGAKSSTLMWAHEHEVESQAAQQLRNIAALPWVHGLRVMPDVHFGKGATVGSVIAMESAVSPSAVGVDIGCGVNAVRTDLFYGDVVDILHEIRLAIEAAVPVGFSAHEQSVSDFNKLGLPTKGLEAFWKRFKDLTPKVKDREGRAHQSLGTLGGGNHFIELCTDADMRIWITLHSGSRNIGKELAEVHINVAKTLPQNQDLPDKDLAVFFRDTPEMNAYRHDLDWAQEFAFRSRTIMMALVKREVARVYSEHAKWDDDKVKFDEDINVHHNYVSEEEIDGKMMLVTRKGAIRAGKGDLALIPGSMGTGSYIVRGLGNPQSFQSASHGAGRRLSRGAAKREFTGDDMGAAEIAKQLGSVESRRDSGILDELPGAYKDLHSVIAAQSELVEPVAHLQTILCVKG
jgi:tRNA-splicing ligase RtcB